MMYTNPFLGVGFHAVGGIAHGSFYVPLKRVRGWAWESAWLAQGLAAWIIAPWFVAVVAGTHPILAISVTPISIVLTVFIFGMMWGAGALTFGLSMRYLGISLGQAVALGYTVSLGTLIPPLFTGQFATLAGNPGGRLVLLGIGTCVGGIALCGLAGVRREHERHTTTALASLRSLLLGFATATFSGIMSAGFAFGIQRGRPISEAALRAGSPALFQNAPTFIVIMGGGFVVNWIWCSYLGIRNRSLGDFAGRSEVSDQSWNGGDRPGRLSLSRNYSWSFISGITWYTGFMLYGMGTTFMGKYDYTSWSIHLAFVIFFSTICGIIAGEWRGIKRSTAWLVGVAMFTLVASTFVIALGNRIGSTG